MKVLHVISDQNIGGAGVLLTSLLKNIDPSRVQSVVALPEGSLLAERISAMDIPVRFLKYPCDRLGLRSVKELERLIRAEHADIVHTNAALCARVAGKACGALVVHTRHCCFPPQGIWKNKLVRKLGGMVNARLSDRVIATAEAAAENLRLYGIPSNSIEVILNGSEPIRAVSEVKLGAWREKLNLSSRDFCVGICARLEEYKGHDTFLRAAKQIIMRKNDVSFRFLIVGDGSMRETLKKKVWEEDLGNYVCFTGFVEDMAPIYRLLDLNVNCSRGTETSCLALSEGMSASVPFIASDFGGNVAMKGESDAGILFPVDDADALTDAICRVAADRALHARMRAAALARYEQNYTAAEMSEHLTAVYESSMKLKSEGRRMQR